MSLSPSELESLLARDRWVRSLARRLAADPATAEDLAQETWLAALSARHARPGERPWLARVLRNAWKDHLRGLGRRQRRERAAAAAEALAPADELVAELELRERLMRALRELEEPLRSTLARRFFRDESLAAIARADGVAVSTVHERLARGLERLRARLDAEHGGRRGAWAATMLALGRRGGGGLGPLEVTGMTAGLKLAAAGVIVLTGVLGWVWFVREPTQLPPGLSRGDGAVEAPLAASSSASIASPPTLAAREPTGGAATSSVGPATEEPVLTGRVVDVHDAPVAGVELVLERRAGPVTAVSEADGGFVLAVDAEVSWWNKIHCTDERLVTLVAGASRGPERLVIVAPRAALAGRVVDPQGTPIAGAALAFRPRPSLFRELGLELAPAAVQAGWEGMSDATGAFALDPVALGSHFGVEARAQGFVAREVDLPETAGERLTVVLSPDTRVRLLSGRVLGPDGVPFEGARVSAGHEIVTTSADGRFELAAHADTGRNVQDEQGTWRPETREKVRVCALAPGHAPGSVEVELAAPPIELVLCLGPEPLSITGHVLDQDGAPRSGVVLWPRALTPFGRESRGVMGIDDFRTVEGEVCGTSSLGAVSAADGSFALGCLLGQIYDLEVFDSRTAGRSVVEGVHAGTRDLEVRLTPEPGTVRVAGRIFNGSSEPLVEVEVRPRRASFDRNSPPLLVGADYSRETDAEGCFEFEALATQGTVLDVFTMPWVTVELDGFSDLGQIEIVVPTPCELQVVLGDPEMADAFAVLDASGAELEMVEMLRRDGRSMAFTMDERVELTDGRSSVVRAPETARTLVLFRDGVEVLRRPLVLDPQGPTRVEL
ncbi:MAG TPA: sigma-70 family RNA polymerase sigma factor [Planctomycetota bacterium]